MLRGKRWLVMLPILFCLSAFAQETLLSSRDSCEKEKCLQSVDELLEIYDSRAKNLLPILIPDPDCMQVVDLGRLTIDEAGDPPVHISQAQYGSGVTGQGAGSRERRTGSME